MEEHQQSTDLQERINRRNNLIDVVMKESPEGEVSVTFKTSWVFSWLRFKIWEGSILLYAEILMGINTCTYVQLTRVQRLILCSSTDLCTCVLSTEMLTACHAVFQRRCTSQFHQCNWITKQAIKEAAVWRFAMLTTYMYIYTYKVDMRSSRKKNLPRWRRILMMKVSSKCAAMGEELNV